MDSPIRILVVILLLLQQVCGLAVIRCAPAPVAEFCGEVRVAPGFESGSRPPRPELRHGCSGRACAGGKGSAPVVIDPPAPACPMRAGSQRGPADPVELVIFGHRLPACASECCVVSKGSGPMIVVAGGGVPRPAQHDDQGAAADPWAWTRGWDAAAVSISPVRAAARFRIVPIEGRLRRALLCVRTI